VNEAPTSAGKYVRFDASTYDSIVMEEDGVLYVTDEDRRAILTTRILRRGSQHNPEEDILPLESGSDGEVPEMREMKLFHCEKLENLFYEGYSEHLSFSPGCKGKLIFDDRGEIKKGVCYKEKLCCKKCKYVSSRHELYDVVQSSSRGAKTAAPNIGLQVGLSHTPAGNTDLRHILNCAGIQAPSRRVMQSTANKVIDKTVDINKANMKSIRLGLKKINSLKGLDPETPILIEGDAQYNNRLGSGVGKTPFQPATQAVNTVCENVTSEKKIISVSILNKLCKKCGGYTVKNAKNHTCINCTANIAIDTSIGDEELMASMCMEEILADNQVKLFWSNFG